MADEDDFSGEVDLVRLEMGNSPAMLMERSHEAFRPEVTVCPLTELPR